MRSDSARGWYVQGLKPYRKAARDNILQTGDDLGDTERC